MPVISQFAHTLLCILCFCPRLARPSPVLRRVVPAQEATRILVQGPCLPPSVLALWLPVPAGFPMDPQVLVGRSHVWFIPAPLALSTGPFTWEGVQQSLGHLLPCLQIFIKLEIYK